jgi:mannose-6-phosphate isomerase-like protein (cupin superfamily)
VKVYELNAEAIGRMVPVDLATLQSKPDDPIAPFDFNGCDCGVASFIGQPPWERHNGGDELLHVLAGESELTVLSGGAAETRVIRKGDLVVVPKGCWHRNHAAGGVTLLFMSPHEGGEHSWDDPRGNRSGIVPIETERP